MSIAAIRALALLLPLLGAAAAWLALQPSRRETGAAFLATLWTLPSLLAVQMLARALGWWTFSFDGGGVAGMPGELLLGWALLWGTLPALLLQRATLPLSMAALAALVALDFVLMPLGAPLLRLGPQWLIGEAVAAVLVLLPAQLLARWTASDRQLAARVLLQCATSAGLTFLFLPSLLFEITGTRWQLAAHGRFTSQLLLQSAIVLAVIGVSAVQEFAERGGGTAFPFDPPKRLVRSGIYAYVRNPMQLSASALFVLFAVVVGSWWLAAAAALTIVFSAGFAAWDEGVDLRERFGGDVCDYEGAVRNWLPSWRPRIAQPSTIYLAAGCDPCSEMAQWLRARNPHGLRFVDAELHPSLDLQRVRYEAPDGRAEEGIRAIARALEHIHFAWAVIGFTMRLPIARDVLQLVVDVSGGGPRLVLSTKRPRRG